MKKTSIARLGTTALVSGAAWCAVMPCAQAQDATFGTPRATSYLGAPLSLLVPVEAAQGNRLTIPCLEVDREPASTPSAKAKVTNARVSFERMGEANGMMKVRSTEAVQESPVAISIRTGCNTPTRLDLVVDVPAAPVAPITATTLAPLAGNAKNARRGGARASRQAAAPVLDGKAASASSSGSSPTRDAMKLGPGFDPQIVLDRTREMPRLPSSGGAETQASY